MHGPSAKRLRVGRFDYVIDEGAGLDIEEIMAMIHSALEDGTVVKVPVLDARNNRMLLYINGSQVDALVIDLDYGPRPSELSP